MKDLGEINAHPRDKEVLFDEAKHKYHIDDEEYVSVTTLIKQFVKPFDKHKWASYKAKRSKGKVTKDQILKQWAEAAYQGSTNGSSVHEAIEKHILGEIERSEHPEFQQYIQWRKNNPHLIPYRAEWIVFDKTFKIAGTIDGVFKNVNTGKLQLIDWKTNARIDFFNRYNQTCLEPIKHLDDCNYIHYSLQLSLYKFILETEYGQEVEACKLVWLSAQREEFMEIPTKDLTSDLDKMLMVRMNQLN